MQWKNIIIIGIIILWNMPVFSQVTYRKKPIRNNPWQADSLWVGAGIKAKELSTDIIVTYKRNAKTTFEGATYFMVPGHQDSAQFLFHNFHEKFPNEPKTVNLGKFPQGTDIVFKFVFTDTSRSAEGYLGKKIYTGQNRPGIDKYVCEFSSDPGYGRRYTLAGRIDSTRIEVGFGLVAPSFGDIVFEVNGANIVH